MFKSIRAVFTKPSLVEVIKDDLTVAEYGLHLAKASAERAEAQVLLFKNHIQRLKQDLASQLEEERTAMKK